MVCMQRSHRTGALTWVMMRSSQSGPDLTTAPSRFDSSGRSGSAARTVDAAAASASAAGAMWCVWNAPATESGRSLTPGWRVLGERGQLLERARSHDLACPVDVGRREPAGLDRGQHSILVAAEYGGHASRLGRGGRHAVRTDPHQSDGVVRADDAGQYPGRKLSDTVPGDGHRLPADEGRAVGELILGCSDAQRRPAAAVPPRCPGSHRRRRWYRLRSGRGRPAQTRPPDGRRIQVARATGRGTPGSGRPDLGLR